MPETLTLLFDTETTSLSANSLLAEQHQPKVIEFYGKIMETGEELEFFCNPGEKLDKKVTEITGLTDDDLASQHPFPHWAGFVRDLVQKATTVVAHNLSYDMLVLDKEFERMDDYVPWPAGKVCTVEATEHLKGYRLSLSALHEELFGEPFSGAHRARQDVEAMERCYRELIARGEV